MTQDAILKTTFDTWARESAAPLYRYAFRLCGRRDVAEELVQETFYHAWRSIRSLKDSSRVRGWLLRILRHRYAHWVRGQRRQPTTRWDDAPAARAVASRDPAPGAAIESHDLLQAALNALEGRYKEPFLLVFLEGMTCREAASQLRKPLGTILSRIHRARAFLRERLRPSPFDDRRRPVAHLFSPAASFAALPVRSPAAARKPGT